MRVLFLGDIVGNPGRYAIEQNLKDQITLNNLPILWAKHAILDWFGVTLAGTKDPLVDILASDASILDVKI